VTEGFLSNDLTSAYWHKAERETLSKTDFQSKWDGIYTHKSSCDLESPLFFRCSNWLLLIESPGDWL